MVACPSSIDGSRRAQLSGGIENGEMVGQAAVRETKEETGLTGSAVKVLGGRLHPITSRHMSYVVCAASPAQSTLPTPTNPLKSSGATAHRLPSECLTGFGTGPGALGLSADRQGVATSDGYAVVC